MRRTSCRFRDASSAPTPRSRRGKNGSVNSRAVGSVITRPTDSLRLVTRLLAARLGTYPSWPMASSTHRPPAPLTFGEPFTTRDTVALETPAARATSSRVVFAAVLSRPFVCVIPTPRLVDSGALGESALTLALHRNTACQESALTRSHGDGRQRSSGRRYARLTRDDRARSRRLRCRRGRDCHVVLVCLGARRARAARLCRRRDADAGRGRTPLPSAVACPPVREAGDGRDRLGCRGD